MSATNVMVPARTPLPALTSPRYFALALLATGLEARLLISGLVPDQAARYQQMAEHPTVFTQAPEGFRLLTPWLVHLLLLPPTLGFLLIAVLATAGSATLLRAWCLTLGLSARASAAGGLLYLVSFGAAFQLWDFRVVDPLAVLGMLALLLALQAGHAWRAALLLPLITLDKEWGLFLLPLFVLFLWPRRGEGRVQLAGIVALAGSALVYLLVRHWPGFGTGAYGGYYSLSLITGALSANRPLLGADVLTAFGLLPPLALWGWRRAPRGGPLRRSGLLVLLAAAQLVAAVDGPRMLAYAFPAVIPLALLALERLPRGRWRAAVLLLGASLVVQISPLVGTLDDTRVMFAQPTLPRLLPTLACGLGLLAVARGARAMRR